MTRTYIIAALLLTVLVLAGCSTIGDKTQGDCNASLQSSYNAAESLPPSPQTAAIEANQVAVAAAIGAPLTTTSATTAAVTGAH